MKCDVSSHLLEKNGENDERRQNLRVPFIFGFGEKSPLFCVVLFISGEGTDGDIFLMTSY